MLLQYSDYYFIIVLSILLQNNFTQDCPIINGIGKLHNDKLTRIWLISLVITI